MKNTDTLGDIRGLILDTDKRPLLRLIPEMDNVWRDYTLSHLKSPEVTAEQIWRLAVADWIRNEASLAPGTLQNFADYGLEPLLHEYSLRLAMREIDDDRSLSKKAQKCSLRLLKAKKNWLNHPNTKTKQLLNKERLSYWNKLIHDDSDRFYTVLSASYCSGLSSAIDADSQYNVHSNPDRPINLSDLHILADILEESVGLIQKSLDSKSLKGKKR